MEGRGNRRVKVVVEARACCEEGGRRVCCVESVFDETGWLLGTCWWEGYVGAFVRVDVEHGLAYEHERTVTQI